MPYWMMNAVKRLLLLATLTGAVSSSPSWAWSSSSSSSALSFFPPCRLSRPCPPWRFSPTSRTSRLRFRRRPFFFFGAAFFGGSGVTMEFTAWAISSASFSLPEPQKLGAALRGDEQQDLVAHFGHALFTLARFVVFSLTEPAWVTATGRRRHEVDRERFQRQEHRGFAFPRRPCPRLPLHEIPGPAAASAGQHCNQGNDQDDLPFFLGRCGCVGRSLLSLSAWLP